MSLWQTFKFSLRLNPLTSWIPAIGDWFNNNQAPFGNINVSGQYGDSPVITGGTSRPPEKSWFQKLWQTVVTVVVFVGLALLLLILFKGYKFVNQLFKLKK